MQETVPAHPNYITDLSSDINSAALTESTVQQKEISAADCRNAMAQLASSAPTTDLKKDLALVFLDIRNFTSLMESHPADHIISVVRRLFVVFNESIKKHGGRVIETAGDSLYVVFGLKTSIKESVNSAYQASKSLFEILDAFNSAYAIPYYGQPWEVGVGLHAGEVFVGQFDLDVKDHLTVMGLPVNIASRLQAESKALNNNFVISEDAFRYLDITGSHPELKTVKLRGISTPVQVRLVGKPYTQQHEIADGHDKTDYLLAISG